MFIYIYQCVWFLYRSFDLVVYVQELLLDTQRAFFGGGLGGCLEQIQDPQSIIQIMQYLHILPGPVFVIPIIIP